MILIQRLRGRFRERFPEYTTTLGVLWWGCVTLMFPKLFDQDFFYPLSLFMSQPFWGAASIIIGLGGFIALLVNGMWRPTAHIRACFAVLRITIWSSLLLASLTTEGRLLGVPTFSMIMALDIFALWWAAGDAKLADEVAKRIQKENGN